MVCDLLVSARLANHRVDSEDYLAEKVGHQQGNNEDKENCGKYPR